MRRKRAQNRATQAVTDCDCNKPRPYLDRWQVIASVALSTVTIVFLYLAFQAQQQALEAQRNALTAQVFASIEQQNAEITKLIFANPKLRPYFDAGSPPSKAKKELRPQIEIIAEMYLDFIETFDNDFQRSLPGMELGGKYDAVWSTYFKDLFARSPALCERYLKTPDWYSPSMCEKYARFTCPCKRPTAN